MRVDKLDDCLSELNTPHIQIKTRISIFGGLGGTPFGGNCNQIFSVMVRAHVRSDKRMRGMVYSPALSHSKHCTQFTDNHLHAMPGYHLAQFSACRMWPGRPFVLCWFQSYLLTR